MKRIRIIKNGVVTNENWGKDAIIDKWLSDEIKKGSFGAPGEYSVQETDITAEVDAEKKKAQFPPVSPRQIRLALLAKGVDEDAIDRVINSLKSPNKEAVMISWKYSTEFNRFAPMVEQIGLLLHYDSVALDALWSAAALL